MNSAMFMPFVMSRVSLMHHPAKGQPNQTQTINQNATKTWLNRDETHAPIRPERCNPVLDIRSVVLAPAAQLALQDAEDLLLVLLVQGNDQPRVAQPPATTRPGRSISKTRNKIHQQDPPARLRNEVDLRQPFLVNIELAADARLQVDVLDLTVVNQPKPTIRQ